MNELTVDLLAATAVITGGALVLRVEQIERRVHEWLKTVHIKFRAVDEDHPDWPGYFVWKSRTPPRAPSATESTQAWWDSLDVEDQERIEQLDDITTGRVA